MLKEYVKVIGDAFLYPFKHWKDGGVLFIKTAALYTIISYIGVMVTLYGAGMIGIAQSYMYVINAILLVLILLAVMPFLVSIVRHVVLGEKIKDTILDRVFEAREMKTLVAYFKVAVLVYVPLFLAGIPFIKGLSERAGGVLAMVGMNAETFLVLLGLVVAIYFLVRTAMLFVLAPLDKDISYKHVFAMTKGKTFHILVIGAMILALMLLLTFVFAKVYVFLVGIVDFGVMTSVPVLGTLLVTFITVAVDLFLGVIALVALSKVYKKIKS